MVKVTQNPVPEPESRPASGSEFRALSEVPSVPDEMLVWYPPNDSPQTLEFTMCEDTKET